MYQEIQMRKKRSIFLFTFQTRVLVTHGVQYLPHMDQIIVLQDGKVSEVSFGLTDFFFLFMRFFF